MTDQLLFVPVAGLFGLLIGSFLNVCIYRWTRDLSVVKPRSACPACNRMIAWYDNVPVLSFLLLRGRCRHCRATISWTYPAVELLTGLFFAWIVCAEALTPAAAKDCLFAVLLIGLIFSDLDTRLLPDEFTLGGLIAGLAFSLFVPPPAGFFGFIAELLGVRTGKAAGFGEAVTGAAIPAGAFWLLRWGFEKIRHKEGAGLGDVKMIAMMGAFLGLGDGLLALTLGSTLGSIVGLAWIKLTGKDPNTYELPMATFLGVGGLAMVLLNTIFPGWQPQVLR